MELASGNVKQPCSYGPMMGVWEKQDRIDYVWPTNYDMMAIGATVPHDTTQSKWISPRRKKAIVSCLVLELELVSAFRTRKKFRSEQIANQE